jgi:3-deoxy-D-manno-octulosonic-acid transferase
VFFIYKGLTWLALAAAPFYVLAAVLRRPGRWREVGERFGVLPPGLVASARGGIWIQAASVGELQLARHLAGALHQAHAGIPIVVSVTTPAARRLGSRPPAGTVGCFTFPVDLPPVVRRVVGLLRPRLFIALETELWPNLYETLRRRGVPVALANGRVSDTSMRRYARVTGLLARTLDAVRLACTRTGEDARRFRDLGLPANRVVAVGDLKFDREPPAADEIPADLRSLFSQSRVLIAGSTHPGEEEVAIESGRQAAVPEGPSVLIVLAPRHLARLPAVERLVERTGLPWWRRSALPAGDETMPASPLSILILDSHGELSRLYPGARACLLGGTLAPVGGHNPLEAAGAGVPVVTGPHVSNVTDLVAALRAGGGLIQAGDPAEAASHLARLLSDDEESRRRGRAARAALEANRGATRRTVDRIGGLLGATLEGGRRAETA